MAKRLVSGPVGPRKRHVQRDIVLPPIPLEFEDAMSRILKAQPEPKAPTKRKTAKKR